jgi:hypothetical protein|tara:strand:- start:34 stop:516 length:483 start_codon:yes stop_codon:yes gene_type:complete
MDHKHLYNYVVHPTLELLNEAVPGMHSRAACRLVTATAETESAMMWLTQHGGGPALGLWQIEPATASDVLDRYLSLKPSLNAAVMRLMSDRPTNEQLMTNLSLGAAACRIKYWMAPAPLPDPDDARGMSEYWKTHYNTPLGAGHADDFARDYADLFNLDL